MKPLAALGYVEGKNLRYETRVVDIRDPEGLDRDAMQLVRAHPDVLLAWQSDRVSALARATATIPIVAGLTADPIAQGLAVSLRRPGKNVTGLMVGLVQTSEMFVALLKAVRPRLRRVAFLRRSVDRGGGAVWEVSIRSLRTACEAAGVSFTMATVMSAADAEAAFAALGDPVTAGAIAGPQLGVDARELAAIAIRRRIALIGSPEDGGLMSYELNFADEMRRVASIVDKILRGADPGGIPFESPDRPVFVINRSTARALGVTIPQELLLRATDIIDRAAPPA